MNLDGIAVGIEDLDLLTAGADFDVVSKRSANATQAADQRLEVVDVEHGPVPAARLLATAVGHRSRARTLRPAQQEVQRPMRYRRDRPGALDEPEPELGGVELDRSVKIRDLVADDGVGAEQ